MGYYLLLFRMSFFKKCLCLRCGAALVADLQHFEAANNAGSQNVDHIARTYFAGRLDYCAVDFDTAFANVVCSQAARFVMPRGPQEFVYTGADGDLDLHGLGLPQILFMCRRIYG